MIRGEAAQVNLLAPVFPVFSQLCHPISNEFIRGIEFGFMPIAGLADIK
jgi:hypothetical protein